MIKVGCCGFPSGMKRYFDKFRLVEVQKTFYNPPRIETARRWRAQAPEKFEFTLKAWQLITHDPKSPTYRKAGIKVEKGREERYGFFRNTREVFDAWERTKEMAEALGSKIILFQCPASFKEEKENIENIKGFFSSIDRNFIFVWEPRGEWSMKTVADLCEELGLLHCTDPFVGDPATLSGTGYLRLHGKGRKRYDYDYTREDLSLLLDKIEMYGAEKVYVLFNNIQMEKNALEFTGMISERSRSQGDVE
ncbi:MAG TPA: DUF72 domain-containing protein [Candidatus Syntrophoarchaeum butanivorans]|uniref:DUF72 domain-containing protein n=1 Tax=Candidatus Syntropharchaeum butanivorans TaxID=1839936 RepID=A0A1F2P674_9EURY|nr:MAG: protein containing DUF72 [Candidatus Syntrophoarchaeum butanivorans]HEC57406.1 DUF72 domain-containing protein [Candidatus Syntrophoarchaeum butanivorans]